jgi:hypothetical protein
MVVWGYATKAFINLMCRATAVDTISPSTRPVMAKEAMKMNAVQFIVVKPLYLKAVYVSLAPLFIFTFTPPTYPLPHSQALFPSLIES